MSVFTCWSVKNVLDLFVDHRLTRDADHWVAEHLQDCDSCRSQARALAPLERIDLPAAALPAGLKEAILRSYAAGESGGAWKPRFQTAQALALVYCLALAGLHSTQFPASQRGYDAAQERQR